MNLTAGLLPAQWLAALWALWLLTLLPLLVRSTWRPLRDPSRLNLWCAAIAIVFTLWTIRSGIKPGLGIHLLGATVLMLMFGPRLAQLALYVVTAAAAFAGMGDATAYPANALLAGAIPVWVSYLLLRAVERWLPSQLFVFIFAGGFFAGALAMVASVVTAAGLHALAGSYASAYLAEYYLPYALLLAWGEAFLTGMFIALMVAYYPQWVLMFDDRRYLARR
ncbi:MAG: energy-coupling factor ABC transporter permease [Burkholderiales bacterium]|nr:energy-coupling factor ABC transporter permease [Burkholderiales bacterium]MDP2399723.1 energy-coupling factor ABC transporter permease [Burkholderiales bacterium]MDP3715051.1 energy-coupling factor ABC transporter permease [Burkholderiales bacterium]